MKYAVLPLLVFTLWVVGCSSETPESLTLRAEKAYAEKAYSKAIASYERLLTVAGEVPLTYYNLALCAYQTEDYSYAIKMVEKAISLGPETKLTDACYELLGMIAEAEKDYDRAANYYCKVLASPDTTLKVRVHSRLASIYVTQKHYDAALAVLLNAQESNPSDPVCLYNLGMLCKHEAMNLRQAALDYFRQAKYLLPEGSSKLKEASNQVQRLESYLTSLKQLPTITGNAKTCAAALKQMRDAVKKRNFKSAEKEARKASEADPSNYDAALEWGRLCNQNKHSEDALKAYDRAIALRPTAQVARYEAAKIAYEAKKYKAAAEYLRPALVTHPQNNIQADLMGRILYAQRQKANAKRWFERYLKLTPKAADSYRQWVKKLSEA